MAGGGQGMKPECPVRGEAWLTRRAMSCPAGAPAWVTPDLIRDTIEAWQPYYAQDLTEGDAVRILVGSWV